MTDEDLARLEAEENAKNAKKAEADKTASAEASALATPPSQRGMSDADLAATRPGILGNTGEDDPYGKEKNLGTTILKGVAGMRGIGEGLTGMVRSGIAGVQSLGSDRTTKQILEDDEKARLAKEDARIARYKEVYAKMPDGPERWSLRKIIEDAEAYRGGVTAENVYKNTFAPVVGEYEPKSYLGKKFRVAGETGIPMLLGGPGAGVAGLSPAAARTGLGAITTGAGTGVAADTVNEAFPNNPNPGFITSLALPFAAHGINTVKQAVSKPDAATTRAAASKLLSDTATTADKEALYQKAQGAADASGKIEGEVAAGEHGPGAPQQVLPQGVKTIGELTGDQGLIDLERATRASGKPLAEGETGPGGTRDINQLQTERAQGRVEAGKTTLDPNSTPEAVAQFVEERQRALDAATESLGDPMAAGERGSVLQEEAKKTQQRYKAETKRLYDAIDPNDDVQVLSPGVRATVKQIQDEHRPGFSDPPSAGVKTYLDRTGDWPEVTKFNDLKAYMEALNEKVRETAPSGGQPAKEGYRHYTMLAQAARADLNNAIANQAAREATLVQQGKMLQSDTMVSRLGALGDVPKLGPTSAVPGGPNMTTETGQALDAARGQRKEQGRIFDNPLVRSIIGASESDVGGLTAKAFPGKTGGGIDKGGEVTRKVLEATGNSPEAISALQDHAISLLQDMGEKMPTPDGGSVNRITPKSVAQFLDKYGSSIDALEAAQPGFRAKFQNVANVQSELARKFLDEQSGAKGGEASRAIVGDLMRDPRNGPAKLRTFMKDAPPDVREGMKHLIVENMFNSSIDEAAGQANKFNGPKFLKLMETNSALLQEAGFTPQHMRVWQAIARDFGEQQQYEGVRLKGKLRQDSGTAGNLEAIDRAFAEETAPFEPKSLRDITLPFSIHQPIAIPFAAAADWAYNKLRQFTHAAKLAGIKDRNDLVRAGIIDPNLGIAMLQEGARQKPIDLPGFAMRLTNALAQSSYYGMPAVAANAQGDKKRAGRAAGGAVKAKCDHAACAARLVSQADKIRRGHARHTKVLLNAPDDAVAKALAIAGRGL